MLPRPRNFADATWQQSISDVALRQVIREGGLSRGQSANMPPHTDLDAAQLDSLVRFIRSVPSSKP